MIITILMMVGFILHLFYLGWLGIVKKEYVIKGTTLSGKPAKWSGIFFFAAGLAMVLDMLLFNSGYGFIVMLASFWIATSILNRAYNKEKYGGNSTNDDK